MKKVFFLWLIKAPFVYLWDSWSRYLTILSTIAVVAGLLGLAVDNKSAYVSIPSGAVLFLLIGNSFVKSIYNLYKANGELKERQKPRLEVVDVSHSKGAGFSDVWGIEIKNLGINEAENSQGQLLQVMFATPQKGISLDRWPTNRNLQWAEGQLSESSGSLSIPGESSAILDVVRLKPMGNVDRRVYIAFVGTDKFRKDQSLSKGYEILFLINVTSKETQPVYAVCSLSQSHQVVSSDDNASKEYRIPVGLKLELLGVMSERPDLTKYQKPQPLN